MGCSLLCEVLNLIFVVLKSIILGIFHAFLPPSRKSVQGEICLITGTGSGIGREMAKQFAKLGATVIMWDVNEKGNNETADMIRKQGGTAYTYTVDVSNRELIYETAEVVKRDHGNVDILINNAGIVTGKALMDIPDEMIVKTMDINLLAHFWTVKSFIPSMKERNHGHIVTIASIAGIIGCNNLVDYCASKFANVGFTESLALELFEEKKTGVKTTVVCPYYIDTGMFAGCKTRFPWMLKHLNPLQAVDRIMQAILTNQKVLYIPRPTYQMALLKAILPVDGSILLHKFFGASAFMEDFVGHNGTQKKIK